MAAYHERRRAERADAGRAADELGDGAEEDEVVEVAPSDIEVAPAAAHYNPFRQSRKGKQSRRKRRRASAAAQLMTPARPLRSRRWYAGRASTPGWPNFIVRQNSLAILEPSRDKFPRAALCFETGPSHKFLAHSHWPGF